ncbi:acyl-CoA reductase [Telmatospirillum sp. J64-1]|uniref:acyl-CoA reductase n=1 Tax=Telmatospirillum sp. J64-1 TaxID=2502183 RepID=UPI001C8F2D8D|nr:acyl-CoA reductase [Telmatospirillum sp. J64-1]
MIIERRLPVPATSLTIEALLSGLVAAPTLPPFDPESVSFLAAVSERLLRDEVARHHPDLQVLAFFLRPASLKRLCLSLQQRLPPEALAVPKGTVLHIPPANVATMIGYSLAPAILAGNRTLLRLPRRLTEAGEILVDTMGAVLEEAPFSRLRAITAFLAYPPDDAVTAALSRAADMRVIWGGDSTISHLRCLPLPPHGTELTFPDRFSWSAIAVGAYLAADEARREKLAEDFVNDVFWFDQQACSSPRLLAWIGRHEEAETAARDFHPRIAAQARKAGHAQDAGGRLARLLALHEAALDLPTGELADHGQWTLLRLTEYPDPQRLKALAAPGGAVVEMILPSLKEASPLVSRRDQTLTHFGFPREALLDFARHLNGVGIDRMVPVGQALSFDTVWDGIDLPHAFLRFVTVRES